MRARRLRMASIRTAGLPVRRIRPKMTFSISRPSYAARLSELPTFKIHYTLCYFPRARLLVVNGINTTLAVLVLPFADSSPTTIVDAASFRLELMQQD